MSIITVDHALAQRMTALQRANDVRLARADLRKRIFTAQTALSDVLDDPPTYLDTMSIGDLLLAQRQWGPSRVRKLLTRVTISPTRPVGQLTDRQRQQIKERLT